MTEFLLPASSIGLLAILIGLHLLAAFYFYRRLVSGSNGVTFALLVHMLAIAVVLAVQAMLALVGAGLWRDHLFAAQLAALISRLVLLLSSLYLVAIAKIEARRPLKKQTWTRERLYRTLRGDG